MTYRFVRAIATRFLAIGAVVIVCASRASGLTEEEWGDRYTDAVGLWDEAQDLALQEGQETTATDMMNRAVEELEALESDLALAFQQDDLQRLARLRMSLAPKLCSLGRVDEALEMFDQVAAEPLNDGQQERLEKDRRACRDQPQISTTSQHLEQRFEKGKLLLRQGETEAALQVLGEVARDYRRTWIDHQDAESLYWGALAKQMLGETDEARLLFEAYLEKPGIQRTGEVENILVTMQLTAATERSAQVEPAPTAAGSTRAPSSRQSTGSINATPSPQPVSSTTAGIGESETPASSPPPPVVKERSEPVGATTASTKPAKERSLRPGVKLLALGAVLGAAGLGQELWLRNDVVAGRVDDDEWELRSGIANITYAWSYLSLGAGGLFLYTDLRGGDEPTMVGVSQTWRW